MISKKSLFKFLTSSLLVMGISAPSFADTLDFSEVASGYTGSTEINLSNATLYTDAPEFYIGYSGQYGETNGLGAVCAVDGGSSCSFDMEISFTDQVEHLSFSSFVVSGGDQAEVSAYNGTTLLGSMLVSSQDTYDFSAFGLITSLFFDDMTTTAYSNGIVYGDFNFETVSAVPLPPSILLFLGALVGLIFLGRKRNNVEV